MYEHLHYESVYFKELHKEQEHYIQSGGSCSVNYYYYSVPFFGAHHSTCFRPLRLFSVKWDGFVEW